MTPLLKKLNFKEPQTAVIINAPIAFEPALAEMAKLATVEQDPENTVSIDFAMVFVLTQAQIEEAIASVFHKLKGDAVLWFCYPKASSKNYKCDFNRDTGWQALGKYSLEGVRQVAIDEDWSALRFRKTAYIKTLTRQESLAVSAEGKERTKKKE